jgi:tetrahydromethanopterin S-methyltransferase subunit H
LIQKADEAGIKNMIVDTAVLDLASIAMCAVSCDKIKTEFGLPVGCAPPNAVFEWKKGKDSFGKEARIACESAMTIFIRDFGADFILFGPSKYAPQIFAPMALHTAITSYYQKRINKLEVNPDVMGKCF